MSYWLAFQAGASLAVALIGCAAMSGGSADVVSIVCTIASGGFGVMLLRMSWGPR